MGESTFRRNKIHPPAAPAVLLLGSAIHCGGYSNRKKYRNGGVSSRSANVFAWSSTISDVRSSEFFSARNTRRRNVSGACLISASVNQKNSTPFSLVAEIPSFSAQSFPVQPGARGAAA